MQKAKLIILLFIGVFPLQVNGFYMPYIADNPTIFWIQDLLSFFILPTILYFLGIELKLYTHYDIGFLFRFSNKRDLLVFLFFLITIPILYGVVRLLMDRAFLESLFPINYFSSNVSYYTIIHNSSLSEIQIVLIFSVGAAYAEEIYFRGMFRQLFSFNVIGSILFIIFSSLAFSSIHWEGGVRHLFLTFILGILTSLLYAIYPNIWPFFAGHLFANLFIYF